MNEPPVNGLSVNELPASALEPGLLWSWIVPAVLFGVAVGATWMLYRHFANKRTGTTQEPSDRP